MPAGPLSDPIKPVRVLPRAKVPAVGRLGSVAGLPAARFPVAGKGRLLAPRAGMAAARLAAPAGTAASAGAAAAAVVSVGQVANAAGVRVDAPVDVEVLDRATARAWAGDVGVRVTPPAGSSSVRVSLNYSGFASAFGGNYAGRLQLFAVPACHATAPESAACAPVGLATSKDVAAGVMTADVPVQVAPRVAGAPQAVALSGTATGAATGAAAGVVVVAAAGVSGAGGDYSADPMPTSGTWAAGLQSGGFTYSYPVPAPPSVGGAAPSLALSYDSDRVDGMTSASNSQSSWLGMGWDLTAGYVERTFHACSFEGVAGSADWCWGGATYFLHLNGKSSQLLNALNGTPGVDYRMKDDPGWQVKRLIGAANGDTGDKGPTGDTGEYWEVRTPDGTVYLFGSGQTTWATPAATNSVLLSPVNGNNVGEPCHDVQSNGQPATMFTQRFCQQAWRWGLDRVTDARGNMQSYTYTPVTNRYKRTGTSAAGYHRDGYLSSVEYGARTGGTPTAKLVFNVTDRCSQAVVNPAAACPALTTANAASYPDVPLDLICPDLTACTQTAPSYFTTVRLSSIQTYRLVGSTMTPVTKLAFEAGFPAYGTGETPDLWLQKITRSGTAFGASAALPAVEFGSMTGPLMALNDLGQSCS